MYIQGFLTPVPEAAKDAYLALAKKVATKLTELGVIELAECWEEDIADGKVTDFRMAVKAEPGEKVVFSWMVWPDKATADAGHEKMTSEGFWDGAMDNIPFDGKRMVYGGFTPIFTMGR
ncbi:MAG: RNA signal recognition particle [Sphingomonadales bacterium 32-64-17]|nr:MAG: RNA signal recognition particle [Sphingomonadales bacterium 32-64-17]